MTYRRILVLAALVLVTTSALPAVAHDAPAKSLYQRIGGYDAICAVVDDFIPRLLGDPQLAHFFGGVSKDSAARIRQHVVDLVCNAAGGPCLYLGRDMKTSHSGLGISEADWNASVKDFLATLAKFKVPQKEQDELVGAVAALKKDIVEKP